MVGSAVSGNHVSVGRRGRARPIPRAGLVLGAALLVVACGGDGGDGGEERSGGDPSGTTEARRTEVQPPASDAEGVRRYIADLLDEHDYVVNQILADPGVARDPQDPLTRRYVDLFAPDSDTPDQLLASFVEMDDAGERMEPYEPGRPMDGTRLDGDVEALAEDEARFPTCNELQYRRFGADGQVIEEHPPQVHPGEGFAVRVGGEWRLWRLSTNTEINGCAPTGGS